MKNIRLNKELRLRILDNVVAKWVKTNPSPERGDKEGAVHRFARAVWDRTTPLNIKEMASNPYIRKSGHISITTDNLNHQWLSYGDEEARPTKPGVIQLEDDDPLVVSYLDELSKVEQANRKVAAWCEKKKAFSDEVKQVLQSVTSTSKLLGVWPEVEPYIPTASIKTTLPAVTTASLNAQLNKE